jgi:hypothetical protein
MQTDRIAAGMVASSTVQGLGACDFLRVELQPVQVPWLIDELEHTRIPIEEELEMFREQFAREGENSARVKLEECEDELRVICTLREQLDVGGERVAFFGPAATVGELVLGTTRHVVDTLSDLVESSPVNDPEHVHALRETSVAARAWVESFVDCLAVEKFSFTRLASRGC